MKTSSTASDSALAGLFEDRGAAAARPPDQHDPGGTWYVMAGRAPSEGA